MCRGRTALDGYEQTARGLRLDPVGDADLPRLVPLLDRARALPHGADQPDQPAAWGLGLSQDAKLAAAAREVYRHALGLRSAAAADLAAGSADARQAEPARLPLRGDARLPHAGRSGAAGPRRWCTNGCSSTGRRLILGPSTRRCAPRCCGISTRCSRSRCRHCHSTVNWSPARAATLPGLAGATRLFAHTAFRRRAASAPWRPSDALGAGRRRLVRARLRQAPSTTASPASLRWMDSTRCCCRHCATAAKDVASESWVLGKRVEIDPNGPQMRALRA